MNKPDNTNEDISRRDFLQLSAGALGLSALGLNAAWAANNSTVDLEAISNTDYSTDVLVIGGGMAGLFSAVKAYDAGAKTMIVSKGRLGSSGLTPFAKGFFVFDPQKEKMTIDEFTDAVSRSALGTNNPVYTRQLAQHSLARAKELEAWGYFDQTLANRSFMNPINERDIPLLERVVITHLIKQDGRISGAAGFYLDDQKTITIRAKTVILCTGAGGFKPSGFPVCDLTHDGSIMAYQIGAKITGKEWNDGHTTRSVNPAACYDNWGDMFDRIPSTNGVEVHHDLGVDVNYKAYVQGNPVSGGPGGGPVDDTNIAGGPQTPDEFKRSGRPPGPPPTQTHQDSLISNIFGMFSGNNRGGGPQGGAPEGPPMQGHMPGATMGGRRLEWPFISPKVWFLLTIGVLQIFPVCMPQAMRWAVIWREEYTLRWGLQWQVLRYKVPLRGRPRLNMLPLYQCRLFPISG